MTITLPPFTGDTDLDYFNAEVARQINSGDLGAGGTSDVQTGTDDEAYPTVGGLRVPYQERYLHTRYGTSSSGANFTDDYTTVPGLTVFQGLRNSSSETESTNPADYTWREIDVVFGWIPSYKIVGGRLVDWDFGTVVPEGYTIDVGDDFDLDIFVTDGMDGINGMDGVNSRVDVAYATATDPVNEVQTLTVDGTLISGGELPPEVQVIDYVGTRSNFAELGQTEMITIGLNPEFNGGINQSNTTVTLGSLGTITQTGSYSWPAGTATPTVTGAGSASDWSYAPGSGSNQGSPSSIQGVLTYNGENPISILTSSISITINVTSLDGTSGMVDNFLVWVDVSSGSDRLFASSTDIPATGTYVFSDEESNSFDYKLLVNGDALEFYFLEFTSSDLPVTYEVVSVEFNTGDDTTAYYDFDIDTSGVHFPGSGGSIEIDCTNVTGDGTTGDISGRLLGSWRTDTGESFRFTQPSTPDSAATEIFVEANTSLRSDVTVRRGTGIGDAFVEDAAGLVVRIDSTDDGFTFWIANSSADTGFEWDDDWGVIPTIYSNGIEYPTNDTSFSSQATVATVGGNLHTVTGNFPANINTGILAAQHLHDQIETTYTGVTVSDPVTEIGTPGSVEIDCTNVTGDGSGTIVGYLFGNWRTDIGSFFVVSQPTTADVIAAELFDEANTSLRDDVTVRRGTGLGDSFVEDADGLVIRIESSVQGFSFWISNNIGFTTFLWDNDWGVIPTIYVDEVEYPTIDTTSTFGSTPQAVAGIFSQVIIVIDTGIDEDISDASLSIIESTGELTEPISFTVTDGQPFDMPVGVHTTYVVRDYSASEVTMFTGSVSDPALEDIDVINAQIVNAINENVETPIDFSAVNDTDNSRLVLTAAERGAIDGRFSVTVNNNGQTVDAGNISYTYNESASTESGPSVGPTVTAIEPGVLPVTHTLQLFHDDEIALPKSSAEIATEIERVLTPSAFTETVEGNQLALRSVFTRPLTDLWQFTVSSLGTSGTASADFNSNDLGVVRTTTGSTGLGDFLYASGRLAEVTTFHRQPQRILPTLLRDLLTGLRLNLKYRQFLQTTASHGQQENLVRILSM